MEIVNIIDEIQFSQKLDYSINRVIMPELFKIFGKNGPALHDTAKYIHDKATKVRATQQKKGQQK